MTTRVFILLAFLVAAARPAAAQDEFRSGWVNQKEFISLKELARVYGARVEEPYGRNLFVANKWNRLGFTQEGREVTINGTLVWLHEPMQLVNGRWLLRATDVRKVVDPIVRPHLYLKNAGYRVIVLDPGHGGQDSGARGKRGVEEKRAVLDIARRVRAQLVNAGYRVYLTRDGDRFVELDERPRKARAWGADLFVSIHLNSAGSADPSGTETYSLAAANLPSTAGGTLTGAQAGNRNDAANAVLGYHLQRALVKAAGTHDRGAKRARFMVLKEATCPAALVECAFVSNRREEEKLLQDEFRQQIADGIARGILNYLADAKRAKLTDA